MNKGSLESFLSDLKKQSLSAALPETVIASITFQVLWGLGYLHFENKLHRDVKPGNVLLSSEGLVKLSDFGISKELSNSDSMSNTSIGTFRYMSPERLMGERYDSSGDVWAVGLILIELHSGCYPFQTFCSTPVDLLDVLEPTSISDQMRSMSMSMSTLASLMLSIDPKSRRSAQELVVNEWFAGARIFVLEDAQKILKQFFAKNGALSGTLVSEYSSSDALDTDSVPDVTNKLLPKSNFCRALEDSMFAMRVSSDSHRRDAGAMDSSYGNVAFSLDSTGFRANEGSDEGVERSCGTDDFKDKDRDVKY